MTALFKPAQICGRAVLQFAYEGDWDATQRNAMYGASRPNILKHWVDMPQFLRRDQGFQCLMDYYRPMTDEEHEVKRAIQRELIRSHVKDCLGSIAARKLDRPLHLLSESELEQEVVNAIRTIPTHRACVDWGLPFGGTTALSTSSTAKTVAGAKIRANQSVRMWGFDIGFDGTTSTSGPAICEIQQNTWATNAPGTNSTSVTPLVIDLGRPETVQTAGGKTWTTEPTVVTTIEVFFIPSYMGSGIVFQPLTKPFVLAPGGSFLGASLRITQQSGVTANATGTIKAEE